MEKKKKKSNAQYSFFNCIIKLQAVLPGSAQKARRHLNTDDRVKGCAGLHRHQKKARPVMYLTVCVVVVSWAFMFITCSSTNGLHLSTEVSLCTGTSNVARGISSELSVCNSVCSFLVNAQSLQRFEGISSYFGILANFNFSSTNQICGSQGSRSLWQEKTCF